MPRLWGHDYRATANDNVMMVAMLSGQTGEGQPCGVAPIEGSERR